MTEKILKRTIPFIVCLAMVLSSMNLLTLADAWAAASPGTYTSVTWNNVGDYGLETVSGYALGTTGTNCDQYVKNAINQKYGMAVTCKCGGCGALEDNFCSPYGTAVAGGSRANPYAWGSLKPGDVIIFYASNGSRCHAAIVGSDGTLYHGGVSSAGRMVRQYTVASWMNANVSSGSGVDSASYTAYRFLAEKGFLKLTKSCVASQAEYVKNSPNNYSLEGAQYGVYTNLGCTDQVGTLTTDSSGVTNTLSLLPGTYYVKEIVASKGYKLDQYMHEVTVTSGNTTNFAATEEPGNDPVPIEKVNKDVPGELEGLEGAEFTYTYYDIVNGTLEDCQAVTAKYSWTFATQIVGDKAYIDFSDDYYVSGDPLIKNVVGEATIPLGTFTIQETKAPKGFYIDPKVYVGHIWVENDKVKFELEGGDYLICEEETIPAKMHVEDSFSMQRWSDGTIVEGPKGVDTGDYNYAKIYVTILGVSAVIAIALFNLSQKRKNKDNA